MRVMGLMSGTSADGIDVAVADIDGAPVDAGGAGLRVRQVGFVAVAWPEERRRLIFDLFANQAPPAELCRANFTLGETFAQAVHSALAELGLPLATVDLIGSHGQTIWHDVADGRVTSTLQIGEPAVIAARTGVTTVADFRVADVAEGGQGAPLVSAFDWHLLRPAADAGGWRAVQNIGGIGNVTFLPPLGLDAPPLAFDTGPGNALIDWSAGEATGGVWTFDQDGELASEGRVIERLLARWLEHPFYAAPPPKTTGRELFSVDLARQWQAEVFAAEGGPLELAATLTELTAASIADAYARFAPGPVAEVVVGGGGARNPTLMAAIDRQLQARLGYSAPLTTHESLGIDSDAKEALAFALLAYLCWHGWPGNVPTCTGAQRPAFLGQIAPGENYPRLLAMRSMY
jgi:anhydro-N-acetylmuramic acid kinase